MNISLKELKKKFSYVLEAAANGTIVQATKRNRPYVTIIRAGCMGISYGKRFGKATIKPGIKLPKEAPSTIDVLREDRDEK